MEIEQNFFSKLPKESLGLIFIAVGALILIGAIRDWDWILEGDGRMFNICWVCNTFGRKIARIIMGVNGIVIIICGIVMFILMKES